MKGFSSKTSAKRLKELDESGILKRQAYNEIPPRVEYRLTSKGTGVGRICHSSIKVDEQMGKRLV